MSRGIGEFGPIQDAIPDWLAVLVAILTQLGDVWFLVLLLAIAYWRWRQARDGVALVAGMFLLGMGLYRTIKAVLALPRPSQPLLDPGVLPPLVRPVYEFTAGASGYGFPSGHATSATVVYLGLALVLPVGTRRQRLVGASGVITLIALSRVALGVHYLVDAVAGVALGGAVVALGVWCLPRVREDVVTPVLVLAIAAAGVYTGVTAPSPQALVLLGATVITLGVWHRVGPHLAASTSDA